MKEKVNNYIGDLKAHVEKSFSQINETGKLHAAELITKDDQIREMKDQ